MKAQTLEEASELVTGGKYKEAKEILSNLSAGNPNLKTNATYLYLSGVCAYESKDYEEAQTLLNQAKSKGNGAAELYLAKLAFLDYDFDKAGEHLEAFAKYRKKINRPESEDIDILERSIEIAENALDRVEKIVVVDSITILRSNFLNAYQLPYSAGRIISGKEIAGKTGVKNAETGFLTEDGDYLVFAMPDSIGNYKLVESDSLIDQGWQKPRDLSDNLRVGNNTFYPYLSGDGRTLYFSTDGDESIGGLDIFLAQRSAVSGDFLQPLNIGMPFNSPFDDYMLVLDEENGIGWWATDRNRLKDKVTIYVYLLNDLRSNYDPDEENLMTFAKLSDYKATWGTEDSKRRKEYTVLKQNGPERKENNENKFFFPMNDGKQYREYADFKSSESKKLILQYTNLQKYLEENENKLESLRRRYSVNKADNVKEEIRGLEKKLESAREELKDLQNQIYKNESSAKK